MKEDKKSPWKILPVFFPDQGVSTESFKLARFEEFARELEAAFNALDAEGFKMPTPMKIESWGYLLIGRRQLDPVLEALKHQSPDQLITVPLKSKICGPIFQECLSEADKVAEAEEEAVVKGVVAKALLEAGSATEVDKFVEDCRALMEAHKSWPQHQDENEEDEACFIMRVLQFMIASSEPTLKAALKDSLQ